MTSGTLVDTLPLFELGTDAGRLDEAISAVWAGLQADRPVRCPVCEGEMRPEYGVHARAIGGRCMGCGSTIQ